MYKDEKEVVGLGLDYKIDFTWLNKAIEKLRKRFDDAAEVVYESGDMQPEMLRKKKIEALISEQALILSHDIDIRGGIELSEETKQKFKEDIYVFSGFKTYHELKEASTLLKDSKGNLKDFDTFKKDILSINDKYNVNYLKAEYNHAKRTMEMAGAYERIYSQRNRVNAKYITVGDEKVRMSHRQLDGIIQPIESPFWETCWPPNGWGCRCDVVAVPKSLEDPTDSADAMFRATSIAEGDPMFATNSYRNGCVFPKKHPYYGRNGYGHCRNPKLSQGKKDLECEILANVHSTLEIKELRKSVDSRINSFPEIADGSSVEIANSKLYSGSLLIRKRSMFEIKNHAISDRPVLEWLSKFKPDQKWEVEYVGWDYPEPGKHMEVELCLYYKIKIGEETRNLSTFIHKGFNNKECPYSILKYEHKGLKFGDPPGKQKKE